MYKHIRTALHKGCGFHVFIATCILTSALLFNLIFAAPAHAYIDPNTGGFFFQTVAPFIYGLLGVIVVFWKRIIGFIKGLISRIRKQDPEDK